MEIQIDRSYFFVTPVEGEIWPGKSEGLVEGKRGWFQMVPDVGRANWTGVISRVTLL